MRVSEGKEAGRRTRKKTKGIWNKSVKVIKRM